MYPRRVRLLVGLFLAALGAVGVQLFRLQIVQGEAYRWLARRGRVWDEITASPRGRVLDARGRVLACERPGYGLALVAADFPLDNVSVRDLRDLRADVPPEERSRRRRLIRSSLQGEGAVVALAKLTGKDAGDMARGVLGAFERVARYGGERAPEPFAYGIDLDSWMRLEVLLSPPARPRNRRRPAAEVLIPGLRCVWRSERAYPARLAACHVVGHVGEYGGDEAESLRSWGRVVARPRSRLAAFRRSAERDDARAAVERILGREIESLESAAELSLLLREPGVAEKLSAALGPAWEEFARWIERPDVVELAEGESVWVRARGHLRDRRVGRIGVERAYNELLRGRHGYSLMIRNLAFEDGRPVPELDYLRAERPTPGDDLVLEIDMALQRVVESALAATGRPGAAVFIDPCSGAVRALASCPGFDPNTFTSGDAEAIRSLLSDPRRPLVNRATQGIYAPGSVFKVIVAAAALEEGVIREDSLFECAHEHRVAGRTLRCMADPGHGEVAVSRALTVSCNIFFYQAVERLGARALLGWARDFGFDAPTGIDLPGERSGTLPRADGAGGIAPTTLALLGIGQGPIAVTPLQVARGFAAIAADGPAMRPHVARLEPRVSSVFALSPHVREAVVKGLKGVVHDPDGTAYRAFHEPPLPGERSFAGEFPGVEVAGKTGTAERSGRPPNAWFAGFAPVDKPEIAFAVVIEGGGHGGDTAAPAAARMLGAYFRLISLPEGTEGPAQNFTAEAAENHSGASVARGTAANVCRGRNLERQRRNSCTPLRRLRTPPLLFSAVSAVKK